MSAGQTWSHDAGDHIAALAWLPDGQRLAVVPAEGNTVVLDRATGAVRLTLPPHASGNCALSIAPNAPLLVTAGHDGKARIVHTETGELLHELAAHATNPSSNAWCEHVQFSPDGKLLATTAGNTLRIWTSAGGQVFESTAHDSTIAALAWRPDSAGVATGCYNGAQLFRAKNGAWEAEPYEQLRWKAASSH